MQRAIPAFVMRGGTSKGLYFLSDDLPADEQLRDSLLLAAMGSPDERQIDGMGGAHPLTSKVAIVSPSADDDADVDYLFLQIFVDEARVSDGQNCGNILAGVGPFAIERGLVVAEDDTTEIRIRMLNSGAIAVARVQTPDGRVRYDGDVAIDGVPGTAAPIMLDFADVAGSNCGALLPGGGPIDEFDGVPVTCIDNGMPVVLIRATDVGKAGHETPAVLEDDDPEVRGVAEMALQEIWRPEV
jgi:4-oxalomesaconate tautomerase